MPTLLVTHRACLDHVTPAGHPERPDRLRAIEQVPLGTKEQIALCHPMDYIDAVEDATPSQGLVSLDADTSMSPGSYEAVLRCVGGGARAVDEVMSGKAHNA